MIMKAVAVGLCGFEGVVYSSMGWSKGFFCVRRCSNMIYKGMIM